MATKEETKSTPELEAIKGERAPLALVPSALPPANTTGYIAFQAAEMTAERKAFLKKQFCPPGCSDIDFDYFVAFCQRTGLDPVLKQAYLVERSAQVNGQWVTRYEPMASVAGMTARADALPDFRGMLGGAVYEGDTISIDNRTQEVTHVTNPLKRGKLIGAWAHIQREGRRVIPSYFLISERIQTKKDGTPTRFWAKMTAGQLLKCCEAEQYRKGYGNIFGGVYVPEEYDPEAGETITLERNDEPDTRSTTEKLADRARAAKDASRPGADTVPPGQRTVDVVAEKSKEAPKTPAGSEARREEALEALANAKPTPEEITALKAKLDAAQVMYEPKRLEDQVYFAECYQKLEQHAKRATGTVSANTMDRSDKAGPAPVDAGPLMVFGPKKGKPIASLEGPELLEMSVLGESKIGGLPPDKAAKVRACIEAIRTEQKKREAALLNDPPEPGSDLDVD